MSSADLPGYVTPEHTADAIAQLMASERGRAVAVNLREFLLADRGIAFGLDRNNWRALVVLLRAAAQGQAVKITDQLPTS